MFIYAHIFLWVAHPMTVGLAWLLRHRHGARGSAAGPQISCCHVDFMQSSFISVYVSNYLYDSMMRRSIFKTIWWSKRNVTDIEMSEVFVVGCELISLGMSGTSLGGTANMGFSCASHWHSSIEVTPKYCCWTTSTVPVFSLIPQKPTGSETELRAQCPNPSGPCNLPCEVTWSARAEWSQVLVCGSESLGSLTA